MYFKQDATKAQILCMMLSQEHGSIFVLKHLLGQVPMRAWLPEVLSELRWFTSSGECAITLPVLLLACILCWTAGLLLGVALAVLVLSPSCRRLVVLALQGVIAVLGPVQQAVLPVVPQRGQLQQRLSGYRTVGE